MFGFLTVFLIKHTCGNPLIGCLLVGLGPSIAVTSLHPDRFHAPRDRSAMRFCINVNASTKISLTRAPRERRLRALMNSRTHNFVIDGTTVQPTTLVAS